MRRQEESLKLISMVQKATRYLHVICDHAKNNKVVMLANHVPFLKKSLEQFTIGVEAMLAANDCHAAFGKLSYLKIESSLSSLIEIHF